ncbi:MAG: hypothetical protein LBD22_01555 [Spirochaetaceae bacterium]|jgi:hypothetical protein|nr:hypothetical protein [Spirochaetaceae bacterium]
MVFTALSHSCRRSAAARRIILAAVLGVHVISSSAALEAGVRRRFEQRSAELHVLLAEADITAEERPLEERYGAFGSSFLVRPAVQHPKSALIVAVPITTPDDTGTERHTGFEFALELLKKRSASAPPVFVAFLAAAWDSVDGSPAYPGFEELLDTLDNIDQLVVLYADITAINGPLTIMQAARNTGTPLEILEPFTNICTSFNVPFEFYTKYNALYRCGVVKPRKPLELAALRDIPLIYVTSSTKNYGTLIDAPALARAVNLWADQAIAVVQDDMTLNYFITGLSSRPVYLAERSIILYAFLFDILLFVCLLFIRYARARTKIYFLVLGNFFTIFFVVMTFLDISLIPLALPALFVLSALFFLQAAQKKWHIVKAKFLPLVISLTVLIFTGLAIIPFADILTDVRRLSGVDSKPVLPVHERPVYTGLPLLIEQHEFLGRRMVKLIVDAPDEPSRYRLTLSLPEDARSSEDRGDLIVYASSVPWTLNTQSVEWTLGSFPPQRLELNFALSAGLNGTFHIEALYPTLRRRGYAALPPAP